MPLANAVPGLSLDMPAGSFQQWALTITDSSSGMPYPLASGLWEYTVRTAVSGGSQLITLTTTPTASGVVALTTTASLSQVGVVLYPAATAALAAGIYYHALWMSPGVPGAFAWFSGALIITGNPQP